MTWLVVALAYAIVGWATLALFAYAAVGQKTYWTSDFWCSLTMSLIWPIFWTMAAGIFVSRTIIDIIRSIRRKLK